MGALLVGPEPFSAEEGRLQPCLDEIGGESEGGDVNADRNFLFRCWQGMIVMEKTSVSISKGSGNARWGVLIPEMGLLLLGHPHKQSTV